jgi:hypothetical protein
MKKIALIVTLAALFVACKSEEKKDEGPAMSQEELNSIAKDSTTIEWLDSTFRDMGKIEEGKVVEVSFRFRNTGSKPLVIADVKAGCGCTTPDKPMRPYAPGEEGVIKASFNSKGFKGLARKYVTVTSNTRPVNLQNLDFAVEVTN